MSDLQQQTENPDALATTPATNGVTDPDAKRHQPVGYKTQVQPLRAGMSSDAELGIMIGSWPRDLPERPSGVLSTCLAAVMTARRAFAQAVDAHFEVLQDDTATEMARTLRSRDQFYRRMQPALTACDGASAAVREEVARLRGEVATRCLPRENTTRAVAIESEVRSLVRSLPVAERSAFIGRAIEGDDHTTVAACLAAGVSPALIGLAPEMAAILRRRFEAKVAPDQLAQIATLERAAAAAQSAGEKLLLRYERAYDHPRLDGSESRASRARRAEATA